MSLKRHEDVRLTPYQDDKGIWTIGIGHNMNYPITMEAAEKILKDDLQNVLECYENLPDSVTGGLSTARRDVILEMIFQLGCRGFRGFKKMLKAMEYKDNKEAYEQMVDSQWYRRYTTRANELAEKFRRG